jgi:uncharacterized protein YdbL (DUF1318 family)
MTPGERQENSVPDNKPESFLRFEIAAAYAQEAGLADRIAEAVKKMPDVVEAYRQMGERVPEIDRLRDQGLVGEGNQGLLIVREGSLSPSDKALMEKENENRRTVMKGMAKAIVRINRKPDNDANVSQVLPQAKEQFAKIRRDSAKKGWWVQDPNGNWSKK